MAAIVSAGSTSFSFIDRFKHAFVSVFSGAGSNLTFYQFGHPRKFPADASATDCSLPAQATKNGSDDAGAHAAVEAHALASGQAWCSLGSTYVSAGSISFSFIDRSKNAFAHHPPTKYSESKSVQLLLYLRASRMTKQAQSNSILAISRSTGNVLSSVAATDSSSHASCRFC